jgi:diguanylate cyclase (GGDEF)-like protein
MAKERTELRHRTDANVDPLTGIANRRSFLHDAGVLAKRHASNPRPAAGLLIDLDPFKTINDRFGHALGDRVLEIFAAATLDSVRGSDLIGRIGGEEFAAVLYDTTGERAVAVAERIRQSFATAAQEVDGRPVCATVSIGVVHCEAEILDVPELLAQADQALYFAKENGRNRVEVASLELLLKRKDEPRAASGIAMAATAAKSVAA